MSGYERHPVSHQPIQTISEHNRIAREWAGLPAYAADDPERPFTAEYETPSVPEPISINGKHAEPAATKDALAVQDVDAYAQKIADNARPVDYPDRTSEAAHDQGWGPIELLPIESSGTAKKTIKPPRRRKGTPSIIRGDSAGDFSRPERESYEVPTEQAKATARAALSSMRPMLEKFH